MRVVLLPLLLAVLFATASAATAAAHSDTQQTFVVVGGSASHLKPAPDAVAEGDKFALPTLPVSIEAAAGLPAVIARLAPPYPLSADDAERIGQLAAATPSADAAGAASSSPPPRAAVLLHLLGVAPEHAESLAERVADTLTDLGAGVVRYLRVHAGADDGDASSAAPSLVRGGGALAAANAAAAGGGASPAVFRVLESPGVADRCGMDCLAHRLGGEVADALRHAYGLDDPEEDAGEQTWETAERRAVRAASVPGELLAGELASALASLAEVEAAVENDAVHVYEAAITGLQLMRAADQVAVVREAREGGSGGLPGAADDADARAHAAADAFLATLEAVHRAVSARHGGAGEVVVQVSLLPDAGEIPAPSGLGQAGTPALALGSGSGGGGEAVSSSSSSSKAATAALTPAVVGGAEAAAMRAPYIAWKRNARRQLLQAAGAWGEEEGDDVSGHNGGRGGKAGEQQERRPFGLAATYWGVAVLLIVAAGGAVYCLGNMPLAEDTLLFGAARRNKGD